MLVVGGAMVYGALAKKEEKQVRPFSFFAAVCAFIFAAQMLNFPIGGGTSGHFMGGALAALLLGPWGALYALAVVLAVQGLFFADGGMMAFGINALNMGLVGGALAWPLMKRLRSVLPEGKTGLLMTAFAGSWLSLMMASAVCALALAASGASPLAKVFPAMLTVHAQIGLGEALMTATLVALLIKMRRTDLLPSWCGVQTRPVVAVENKRFVTASLIIALMLAVLVSPFASAFPDGLEHVAQAQGFIARAEDGIALWTFDSNAMANFAGVLLTFISALAVGRFAQKRGV